MQPRRRTDPDSRRSLLGEAVGDIESTVTFLILTILFVPIGLVVLVVGFVLLAGLFALFGTPTGTFGTIVMLGWLGLILAALVLTYRALFRRLPRRVREHAVPGLGRSDDAAVNPSIARLNDDEADVRQQVVASPAPSLAELDARIAPRDQSS